MEGGKTKAEDMFGRLDSVTSLGSNGENTMRPAGEYSRPRWLKEQACDRAVNSISRKRKPSLSSVSLHIFSIRSYPLEKEKIPAISFPCSSITVPPPPSLPYSLVPPYYRTFLSSSRRNLLLPYACMPLFIRMIVSSENYLA